MPSAKKVMMMIHICASFIARDRTRRAIDTSHFLAKYAPVIMTIEVNDVKLQCEQLLSHNLNIYIAISSVMRWTHIMQKFQHLRNNINTTVRKELKWRTHRRNRWPRFFTHLPARVNTSRRHLQNGNCSTRVGRPKLRTI